MLNLQHRILAEIVHHRCLPLKLLSYSTASCVLCRAQNTVEASLLAECYVAASLSLSLAV